NQVLDHFLNEYRDRLMHVAGWIANDSDAAPEGMADDSIRLLQQTFEEHGSPNARAIADICEKMASSLLMLRDDCNS
ncbi:MAG: hypothetical protein WCB76_13355, partial [Acidobacteriaceae bacterium]